MCDKSFKTSKFATQNNTVDKEACKSLKKDSSSIINNSTLSLHIAAYERSNKTGAYDSDDDKKNVSLEKETSGTSKEFEDTKQILINSTFVIQKAFEFPRQQNDEITEPELSQFKASQRLINPNEASDNRCQQGNELVLFIWYNVGFKN
uniref:Uncharacterized protein n=1 Tax=Panagrolaimus davidi TaxID=227884 RepID=A0A914P2K3_9BILA